MDLVERETFSSDPVTFKELEDIERGLRISQRKDGSVYSKTICEMSGGYQANGAVARLIRCLLEKMRTAPTTTEFTLTENEFQAICQADKGRIDWVQIKRAFKYFDSSLYIDSVTTKPESGDPKHIVSVCRTQHSGSHKIATPTDSAILLSYHSEEDLANLVRFVNEKYKEFNEAYDVNRRVTQGLDTVENYSPPRVTATLIHHSLAKASPLIRSVLKHGGRVEAFVANPRFAASLALRERILDGVAVVATEYETKLSYERDFCPPPYAPEIDIYQYNMVPSLRATIVEWNDRSELNRLVLGHYVHYMSKEHGPLIGPGHDPHGLSIILNGSTPGYKKVCEYIMKCRALMLGREMELAHVLSGREYKVTWKDVLYRRRDDIRNGAAKGKKPKR